MRHFYVLIDQDIEGELVYKVLSHQNFVLEASSASGNFPAWHFQHKGDDITVYGIALQKRPVGDNREEIELRVLVALDLV